MECNAEANRLGHSFLVRNSHLLELTCEEFVTWWSSSCPQRSQFKFIQPSIKAKQKMQEISMISIVHIQSKVLEIIIFLMLSAEKERIYYNIKLYYSLKKSVVFVASFLFTATDRSWGNFRVFMFRAFFVDYAYILNFWNISLTVDTASENFSWIIQMWVENFLW